MLWTLLAGVVVGWCVLGVVVWVQHVARGEAVHLAERCMESLWRERDERKAERASLSALVAEVRAEAFQERQDLYRRIQAPETGGYVLTERQGVEPVLHEGEDAEIARQQALDRAARETAGLMPDPSLAR